MILIFRFIGFCTSLSTNIEKMFYYYFFKINNITAITMYNSNVVLKSFAGKGSKSL